MKKLFNFVTLLFVLSIGETCWCNQVIWTNVNSLCQLHSKNFLKKKKKKIAFEIQLLDNGLVIARSN